jgi:hypothetical protein
LATVTRLLPAENSMITRITRGVLDVDREAEMFEALRTAAASRQKHGDRPGWRSQ